MSSVPPPAAPRGARLSSIHAPVFIPSAALLVALLVVSAAFPETSVDFFASLKAWILTQFDWLYIITIAAMLPFALWLALGRYGSIRLGPDDAQPDYSRSAWIAMLFAAGMGIGLVFWGVAEPMIHAAQPPTAEPMSAFARAEALPRTLHHWGLHAWAMYAVLALSIAFFGYRRGLPLTLRSCFHPLLGDRIDGPIGDLIDALAVFGTLFGLATSLGLGAGSISAGLAFLLGTPHTTTVQVIIIVVVTICATLSLVLGVDKGIKKLSELNMILAALLLLFVFVTGPTGASLDYLVEGTGGYIGSLFERSMITGASGPESEGAWIRTWSVVYWGWWIAWAPFVAVFVARISRGRTIREFVLTVSLVPSAITILWFGVFSGAGFALQDQGAPIAEAAISDPTTAIYVFLNELPLSTLSCAIAAIVVAIFFVSSSDSASYVVDMLTSGGNPHPPVWQRVFWASAEGATAAVLIAVAGADVLEGLKAGVVAFGLPFCILLILACIGLVKALSEEQIPEPSWRRASEAAAGEAAAE